MTPAEFQSFIARTRVLGSRPGLSRIRALLTALGNPQEGLHIVHITGTNGKGSCAAAVYAGLLAAGLAAGSFMSPEIFRVNERISAAGEDISTAELCAAADEVLSHWQALASAGDPPTEFELFVALALVHFRRRGITHAVIEVGMGGRGDATNVFSCTEVCVLTPISPDHSAFLGSTVTAVAEEKCGILRQGCTVVTPADQHPEALAVIRNAAEALGCRLVLPDPEEATNLEFYPQRTEFDFAGRHIIMPFGGDFQLQNGVIAAATLSEFAGRCGFWTEKALSGMRNARLTGRFSRISEDPEIYADAGHNPAAADALLQAVKRHLSDRPLYVVMGMYRDKDYPVCIRRMAKVCTAFYAVQSDNPRALSADAVAEEARSVCPEVYILPDPGQGLRAAAAAAKESGGRVLLCGSFGHISRALEGLL